MKTTPNLICTLGISTEEIEARVQEAFYTIFADENERFYFELAPDAGYMLDTGNFDVRSEGMSYGMMMAVQMDRQDIFNRLWIFSKRFMYNHSGPLEGYFAWSVKPDGQRNSHGPAPDGEEYFAMALFFASSRWGDGEAPMNYAVQARDILRHAVHQHEIVPGGEPMWDPHSALIRFVPELQFSDPSYHLPHFYERFAQLSDEQDFAFWKRAAKQSRLYIAKACHPTTGMAPEYAHYDGTPETKHGHDDFFSDSYRVAMNIALDSAWNGPSADYKKIADRLQQTLSNGEPYMTYTIDGTPKQPPALHPTAIVATTASLWLASDTPLARKWAQKFWNMPMRRGDRRYYDNCLYFFCLLMLSGKYKMLA